MFTDFRKRGKERERNTDVREKHLLVASSTHPQQGSNPQSRHLPCLGIKPATFGVENNALTN